MAVFLDDKRFSEGLKRLSLNITDEQKEKLDLFASLLFKWNKTFNLTSLTNKDDILTHHILDSLAAVSVFQKYIKPGCRLLDVGSGGGLPAIPMAIIFPDCSFTLIDTVGKKTAFLTQVALTLKLSNVTVLHDRVENVHADNFDLISSRAFASLSLFIKLSKHLLKPDGFWLALKGQYPTDELQQIENNFKYSVLPIQVPFLEENRNIIIIPNDNLSI